MSRCPLCCCSRCRDELCQERIAWKMETRRIDTCSIGPAPEINHDSDLDSEFDTVDLKDEPTSVEEGDQILATGLLPSPSIEIRASSTISQSLAEAFQANTELTTPIPDYLKEFTSMFSKQSFCQRTPPLTDPSDRICLP